MAESLEEKKKNLWAAILEHYAQGGHLDEILALTDKERIDFTNKLRLLANGQAKVVSTEETRTEGENL